MRKAAASASVAAAAAWARACMQCHGHCAHLMMPCLCAVSGRTRARRTYEPRPLSKQPARASGCPGLGVHAMIGDGAGNGAGILRWWTRAQGCRKAGSLCSIHPQWVGFTAPCLKLSDRRPLVLICPRPVATTASHATSGLRRGSSSDWGLTAARCRCAARHYRTSAATRCAGACGSPGSRAGTLQSWTGTAGCRLRSAVIPGRSRPEVNSNLRMTTGECRDCSWVRHAGSNPASRGCRCCCSGLALPVPPPRGPAHGPMAARRCRCSWSGAVTCRRRCGRETGWRRGWATGCCAAVVAGRATPKCRRPRILPSTAAEPPPPVASRPLRTPPRGYRGPERGRGGCRAPWVAQS